MADVISVVAVIFFFIIIFTMSDIKEILKHRSSMAVEAEKERTKQKNLDLEIAKVNTKAANVEV